MSSQPFVIFGNAHLITLFLIIAIALIFPLLINSKDLGTKILITKIIGISAIGLELIKPFIWHYGMHFPWIELIPIHMCNLSTLFIGIFLITEKRLFFEVSFFWGIGGGINALITPDIPNSFPDPQYILFFIGHGFLIIAIAYACIALGNRPTLSSIRNGIYFSLSTLPIIFLINKLLGPKANYWYLGVKPAGESILDFLPTPPFHIPVLIILGIILFFLIYSPYWIYDTLKKKDAE
ncbi:MAG: TIGR02206 family membrane protein [SAR86 cluster bacterium]|nr:TIGR02206 family membrane protein [SAR86 cluster bacterium]